MSRYLITSPGRTGTQSLAGILDQLLPHTVAHEPRDDLFHLGVYYHRKHRIDHRQALRDLRRHMPADYVEINPHAIWITNLWKHVFPETKIILLSRDVRTWLPSMMGKKGNSSRSALRLRPQDFPGEAWRNMSRMDVACWKWAKTYNLALPHANIIIKYESIFQEPYTGLSGILSCILGPGHNIRDLPAWPQVEALLGRKIDPTGHKQKAYDELSRPQQARIHKRARHMMEVLGYE